MDSKRLIRQLKSTAVARRLAVLRTPALVGCVMAVVLVTASCFPNPPEDDEGHATFARELFPVLLGRRAYGVDEVEAVADIAQLLGRETAARMLMREEAFVDHWADALIDIFHMQRDAQGGIAAQDQACWGAPTREDPDPAIAEWVRDHAPGDAGAPTPAWNMTDLLRSAIAIDDLSPVYRANLFTLSMRRGGFGEDRAELTDILLREYLNRDITCLRCHNPTYSTSNKTDGGGNIVWRRLWSIPGHPEKALFGNYYDTTAAIGRIRPIMRGDVRQPDEDGFGMRPWGISQDCAKDTQTRLAANNGTLTHTGFKTLGSGAPNYANAGFGSLDGGTNPKVSLWELEASLRKGINDLKDGYERFDAGSPLLDADEQRFCDVVAVFSSNCTGCHSGGSPSANMDLSTNDLVDELVDANTEGGSSIEAKRVVAGNTGQSELSSRVNSGDPGYQMPPGSGLSGSNLAKVDDWITDGSFDMLSEDCNTSEIPDVHPDEAFAFLTAANLVDGIWTAAMGYPLTIDHGYPRNKDQRDMLWNLTEYEFIKHDWSLKTVLAKIVSSDWFARRAPTISQRTTAYELPPLLDPWVVADPTEVSNPAPHERANGQGELVNRFRVNTALQLIASSLAWKEPRRFPGGGYPSPLDEDLGQYLSPAVPGFGGVNFQSLLALESQTGLCNKSGRSEQADDWIDQLVAAVNDFNTDNPDAPITLGEVWLVLKDRLIQDPTIERHLPADLTDVDGAKTEEEALIDFFNEGLTVPVDLNTSAGVLSSADLESKLRAGCGVLVKTPEFLLTNVTPRGYSDNDMPDPPRLNVCMDGEDCGYAAACGHWRSVAWSMGHNLACEDRSVRYAQFIIVWPWPGGIQDLVGRDLLNYRVRQICPGGNCGFVTTSADFRGCARNVKLCGTLPSMPPACDPRVDACGGPLPSDMFAPGVFVAWLEGAVVTEAQGVRVKGLRDSRWRTLKPKSRLKTGELLFVPVYASLEIRRDDETLIDVPAMDRKELEGVEGHYIAVTGPSVQKVLDAQTKKGAMSVSELRRGLESGRFESDAPDKRDWQRIIDYGARPESRYTPTLEDIRKRNADHEALHFPPEFGLRPDGTDPLPDSPEQIAPPDQRLPKEPDKPPVREQD